MLFSILSDPVFKREQEEGSSVLEVLSKPWPEVPKALQADISALQWVEDLELRVTAADLHLKVSRPCWPWPAGVGVV